MARSTSYIGDVGGLVRHAGQVSFSECLGSSTVSRGEDVVPLQFGATDEEKTDSIEVVSSE
jgi:hypothetical protein